MPLSSQIVKAPKFIKMATSIIKITDEYMIDSVNPATKDVVDTMMSGKYINTKKEEVSIQKELDFCLKNTKSFPPDFIYKYDTEMTNYGYDCKVEIRKETTIDACYRLVVGEGLKNVCALNFANAFQPGGGVSGYARAQEEECCRASALYYSLIQKPDFYEYHIDNCNDDASDYMIFSPEVPIWKHKKYEVLDKPFTASFITAAAVNTYGCCTSENSEEINDHRIKVILECAIENGAENLVLGAFGCGAFGNDPYDVSGSFKKYLYDEGMMGCFKSVTFSFVGKHGNIKAFSEVFQLPIIESA